MKTTKDILNERKALETNRADNRLAYEANNIDYNTYASNERKIDRKFESILRNN